MTDEAVPTIVSARVIRAFKYLVELDPATTPVTRLTGSEYGFRPSRMDLEFRVDEAGRVSSGEVLLRGRSAGPSNVRVSEIWYANDRVFPEWIHSLWSFLDLPEGVYPHVLRELFSVSAPPVGPQTPAADFPVYPRPPEAARMYPDAFLRPDHRPTPGERNS